MAAGGAVAVSTCDTVPAWLHATISEATPLRGHLSNTMRGLRTGLGLALIGSLFALLVWRASVKPFWHDEIYTILEAQLPIATLWRACLDGIDLQPPLNAILTRGVHLVVGVGPIATRLPAISGFLLAMVLTFIIVGRRTNGLVASAAVLLLCTTQAWWLATDARGYGLTFGAFAIALFAWTEAAAGRHTTRNWILLAVSVAAGIWAHYFFVLALVPIGLGEIVRQLRLRRFAPESWLAVLVGILLALPLWPLASAASGQRSSFWAVPTWDVVRTYRHVAGAFLAYDVVIAILAVVGVVEITRRIRAQSWPRVIPSHEIAAAGGCLAIPLVGMLVGHWIGVFYVGYITFAAVGFAIVLSMVAWALLPKNRAGGLLLAGTMVIAMLPVVNRSIPDGSQSRDAASEFPAVVDWLRGPEPLVFSGGLKYLEIWYALPEDARPRFIYLADPEGSRRDLGHDTVELGYLALGRWSGVPVVPLREYIEAHPRFWLYVLGSRSTLTTTLRDMGAQLIEHGRTQHGPNLSGRGTLYEVRTQARSAGSPPPARSPFNAESVLRRP